MFTILIAIALGILLAWGLGYVNIGLQIKRYPAYWSNQASKPDVPNQIIYVALGDSTAQGIGASSPARGYVGLVAKHITESTGRPVKVINVSVSGAKVADLLKKQLPQIADNKADVVTVEIGANDVRTYNKQQFDTEFAELLTKLPAGTYVSDMPRFDNPAPRAIAVEMSATIAGLVATSNHKLVPLFRYTSNNTSFWRNSTDRFHPSNQSYKYWADAFWSQIVQDLKK